VALPASIRRADPCALTLLAYLDATLGLVPVACQVAIRSRRLGLATAIDVLCVDRQTRSRLHLLEIKASRMTGGATPSSMDACYRHVVGEAVLPRSSYWQHQLQLWVMAMTLREEYGIVLASAAVVRTSPSHVFYYPLEEETFARRRTELIAKFR